MCPRQRPHANTPGALCHPCAGQEIIQRLPNRKSWVQAWSLKPNPFLTHRWSQDSLSSGSLHPKSLSIYKFTGETPLTSMPCYLLITPTNTVTDIEFPLLGAHTVPISPLPLSPAAPCTSRRIRGKSRNRIFMAAASPGSSQGCRGDTKAMGTCRTPGGQDSRKGTHTHLSGEGLGAQAAANPAGIAVSRCPWGQGMLFAPKTLDLWQCWWVGQAPIAAGTSALGQPESAPCAWGCWGWPWSLPAAGAEAEVPPGAVAIVTVVPMQHLL